jgi:hypothetical protein
MKYSEGVLQNGLEWVSELSQLKNDGYRFGIMTNGWRLDRQDES